MVYFDGEYHLFYQYNPLGDIWGHIGWGHAVSNDLLKWKHLPLALTEENDEMIFSGSAVVDWKNTSGFQTGSIPPMVAIYTGHREANPIRQYQCLAYSNDRGRSWTKFNDNPVLDIGHSDFRDPKVFWHKETQRWIMTVALSADQTIQIYASPNLKDWNYLSNFTVSNSPDNLWECPDLFPLPVDDDSKRMKWVLIISVNPDALHGGSGMIYFIGEFDGKVFIPDPDFGTEDPELPFNDRMQWVDHGKDFYAAVSWSDIPKVDGRRIWLGWMNSWEYARETPTNPWRGMMSIPRTLGLKSTDEGIRLIQTPVKELQLLHSGSKTMNKIPVEESYTLPTSFTPAVNQYKLTVDTDLTETEQFGIRVCKNHEHSTTIEYDKSLGQISFDRSRSGSIDFHSDFSGKYTASFSSLGNQISITIFVDQNSIEIFVNEGIFVSSNQIFPAADATTIEFYAVGLAVIESLKIFPLGNTVFPTNESD